MAGRNWLESVRRFVRLRRPRVVLGLLALFAKDRGYWPSAGELAVYSRTKHVRLGSAETSRKWLHRLRDVGFVRCIANRAWSITRDGWQWSGLEPVVVLQPYRPAPKTDLQHSRLTTKRAQQRLLDAYRIFENKPQETTIAPWTPPAPQPPPKWLENLPQSD